MHKILSHGFSRLTSRWIEVIAQRVIEVLALDRFVDFATGSNSVAPVRETAAQSLCVLICKIPGDSRLLRAIINHLQALLKIDDDKVSCCLFRNPYMKAFIALAMSSNFANRPEVLLCCNGTRFPVLRTHP